MIPHNKPSFGELEKRAAARVIDSGWVAAGREVAAFEEELADFVGTTPDCVLVTSSGSAALLLALLTSEGRRGTVAIPTYGCSAAADAASLAGLGISFVDSANDSPLADWRSLDLSADTAISVDLFGIPADLPSGEGCRVISDAAQSLGATANGVASCLRGDLGILSFSPTKIMTVGGYGGAIVSTNADWVGAARDYSDWDGRTDGARRFHFKLGDIGAGIGRVQLARLGDMVARRHEIHDQYLAAGIPLLTVGTNGLSSVYRAVAVDPSAEARVRRLRSEGVGAIEPYGAAEMVGRGIDSSPKAASWSQRLVSLPIFADMTDAESEAVIVAWERTA